MWILESWKIQYEVWKSPGNLFLKKGANPDQNKELVRDLAEREAGLEELANLVSTKDEVIKNAERRLLEAKKLIADLKAEVQSLRSRNDHQEPAQQTPQ